MRPGESSGGVPEVRESPKGVGEPGIVVEQFLKDVGLERAEHQDRDILVTREREAGRVIHRHRSIHPSGVGAASLVTGTACTTMKKTLAETMNRLRKRHMKTLPCSHATHAMAKIIVMAASRTAPRGAALRAAASNADSGAAMAAN